MANEKGMIVKAIENMALLDSWEDREELRRATQGHTFESWKSLQSNKVAAAGFGSGLLGGPIGLGLEAADTGYLLSVAGRACYGVGHILGKKIDYKKDIEGILAIWAGVGKGYSNTELNVKVGSYGAIIPIGGKMAFKATAKVSPKFALKLAAKASSKIIGKAGAKAASKVAGKASTKWIPLAGGVISAAINKWVVETLLKAAEEYYEADYVLIEDEEVLNGI